MRRFLALLLLAASLAAGSQSAEKTEEAADAPAKRTAKVIRTPAKDDAVVRQRAPRKSSPATGPGASEVLDTTKTAAGVAGADAASATKNGGRSVVVVDLTGNDKAPKVNLNTATRAELISLPGIGDANADKIIRARPIASVEQLSTRKIIQRQYYQKVRAFVTVR